MLTALEKKLAEQIGEMIIVNAKQATAIDALVAKSNEQTIKINELTMKLNTANEAAKEPSLPLNPDMANGGLQH